MLTDAIYRVAPFAERKNFGEFLSRKGLLGTIVEIGVHQGFFAKQLLASWDGDRYIGVDPWAEVVEGYGKDQTTTLPNYGKGGFSNNARVVDLQIAASALEPYGPRAMLLRTTSELAAALLPNGLDFVYIDGNHRPEYVLADLEDWYPKVKSKGIIAGHDIYFQGKGGFCDGVEPIVRNFFRLNDNGPIRIVKEPGRVWSWYVEKL